MKNIGFLLILVAGLVGCATPVTALRNDATGQVTECGGRRSGSATFGLIGYSIQKANDEKCVERLKAQGYRQVQ